MTTVEILDLQTFRGGDDVENIKTQAQDIADKLEAVGSDAYRWILLHLRGSYTLPSIRNVVVFGQPGFENKILCCRGQLDGTDMDIAIRINPCMCGCNAYYIKVISIRADDVRLKFVSRKSDLVLRSRVRPDDMGTIAGITKFLIRFVKHFYIAMHVRRHQRVLTSVDPLNVNAE